MTTFKVRWEIDIEAETPREAAHTALQIQRNPDSIATVFEVLEPLPLYNEHGTMVDLSEPGDIPGYFRDEIASLDEAKGFLTLLHSAGKLFHLEESPETIIKGGTEDRLFTDEEAELLEQRVDEVFHWFGVHGGNEYGGDPFAFIMDELLDHPLPE